MTETIRFPNLANPTEATEVVTLLSAVTTLPKGGAATYVPISTLKTVALGLESPFVDLVLEFTASAANIVGNGTELGAIGLYGQLGTVAAAGRTLLGILGITLAPGRMPQIPLVQNAAAQEIGFSQIIQVAAVYTALSIGGIQGDIPIDVGTVTVKVRPVHFRDYIG